MAKFDPATLSTLRTAREIAIRASRPRDRSVIIWVVVLEDDVFVRSVRGPRGLWFAAAKADGRATLEVGDQRLPARVTPVTEPATIDAVSEAFLTKYAASPWAKSIVAPETLPTTLMLGPLA